MPGKLWGVGLGPGDPELVTVKAARLIGEADVIAYHCARHGRSIARSVAAPHLRGDQIEERLMYPVTTETTDHPGGYAGAIAEFYEHAAKRLAEHLDAGRDVVLLCEGDPFFYGSYMHMHERLCDRYEATAVPGVTSVSAASAALGKPLAQKEETLTVLPGTLPTPELAMRLADADSAAVMKLGRTFGSVRQALAEARIGAGRLIVSGIDLEGDLETRPVARALRNALADYAAASENGAPAIDAKAVAAWWERIKT
jgi:precorrin-2 C20-methyltransferase/precorrin-3B C17-methyltransferase